jgi:serine/threonine-protein kinase
LEPEPSASNSVLVVGRYALYDAIAAGGMATVHYGRLLGPVGFSRTVAIKRLHAQFARDPEFVSMFLDEARLAARIRHPNVVPTLDVVATDGELFLVMEYVPGESFARLVRTAAGLGTVIPPRIVIAIISGVLRGLHAAHEATNERGEPLGIVHRDVSPQNILVGIDGQARVLDFGVAKAAGRLQTTRDGKLKGKLAYMSPEQLRGKTIDRRTDVFAAATCLWEGLTGRRLFRGDNEGAIITKILSGEIETPSSAIPPGEVDAATLETIKSVDDIVLRGLVTDLDQRWDSARSMAIALEKALPPAGVSEVSEWVEHFAKDVLVTRAQQVADIESNSSVGGHAVIRQLEEARDSISKAPPPRESKSRVTENDETRSAPIDLSTISVASHAQAPSSVHAKRKKMLRGVVGGVGVLGALIVFLLLRARALPTQPMQPTQAAQATSSPATPSASAPQPASSVAAAPSSAAPEPSASGEPEKVAEATPPPPPKPKLPQSPRPWTPPPPHPKPPLETPAAHPPAPPSCNPPFTYDSQGLKHFKPECL